MGVRRHLLALAAVVTVTVALAACGSTTGAVKGTGGTSGSTPGGGLPAATGELHHAGFCPTGLLKLRAEPVPASFDVGAAYECEEIVAAVAGRGEWVVEEEVKASAGLGRLLSALRRPDQNPPAGGIACPLDEVILPQLVLVGRGGAVVRPAIPTDQCQQPQAATLGALRALAWTVVHRQLLHQTETPAELVTGCPPSYKDLFDTDAPYLRPAGAGSTIGGHPASITLCVYRDTNPALNHPDGSTLLGSQMPVGDFVAGRRVSGTTEAALLEGLRPGRSTTGCEREQPEFATVVSAAKQWNTFIELGGCDRVLRISLVAGNQPHTDREIDGIGQATPRAVALVEHAVGLRS
jgi:hypothetical protein